MEFFLTSIYLQIYSYTEKKMATNGAHPLSEEYSNFRPTEERVSQVFPEIELAYNQTPKDNPRIHPLCLCPKDSVIVAKQDALGISGGSHLWASCPIEKCFRGNNVDSIAEQVRVGATTVDGCLRGVLMPPFSQNLLPNAHARQHRSYGVYANVCSDPYLIQNQKRYRN